VLLIIEDDVTFARILVDMAHSSGLKAVVALAAGPRRCRSPANSKTRGGHPRYFAA